MSAVPDTAAESSLLVELGAAAWATTLELAPWLLLGTVIAGILHGLLPADFVRRQLRGGMGVFKAVALGVPLPLCSCGVIPAALGLRRDGASRGASLGFLTSTPQTGVDSVLVSASFLGWPFALFKVAAALCSGVLCGTLVDRFDRSDDLDDEDLEAAASGTDGVTSCAVPTVGTPRGSFADRLRGMADHSLDVLHSIWGWLVFGVAMSAIIQVLVPDAWLQSLGDLGPLVAGLAALAVSAPLYVCAVASVPIAAALVAGGMPAGAALVFLMAGPETNVATMGAVLKGFGARALAIYLSTVVVFALGAGVLFEQIIPTDVMPMAVHEHGPNPVAVIAAVVLLLLLTAFAASDARRFLRRRTSVGDGAGALQLEVDGMTCGGCAGKVERALADLPGVEAVDVGLDPGRARIAGTVARSRAVEAVQAAGYSVREQDATGLPRRSTP